ncbi:MAG: nucleotidyl transferase AbiEii/AbiGii toxin family protein [bacterium]
MLNISEIEKFYDNNQRLFKRNILREYLQYKILQIIFNSEYSSKLSFMGGTCLRIIFGTHRFSEDLDFDNFGLTVKEFTSLSQIVLKALIKEGYSVEIKIVNKGAFRCYIRIPNLLFDNQLSGYKEEKILIQLDTENQNFVYASEAFLLNKFDIFTKIFYTPKEILLSQKIWAIINRKTPKGRDFYDTLYLFSIAAPNYNYLENKAGIKNLSNLKNELLKKIKTINFTQLKEDVSPFLMNSTDLERIGFFPEYINNLEIYAKTE